MPHQAEIAHHIRGRVRMKIPIAKGNEPLLEQVKRALSPIPGMLDIQVNPSTGSLILHYDPEVHENVYDMLRDRASDHVEVCHPPVNEIDEVERQLEAEAEFLAEHSHATRAVVDMFKGLDRAIKVSTQNAVDLKVLVPLGLAAYTFLELGVEASTPVWLTLGMFAINHFIELHEKPSPPTRKPQSSAP